MASSMDCSRSSKELVIGFQANLARTKNNDPNTIICQNNNPKSGVINSISYINLKNDNHFNKRNLIPIEFKLRLIFFESNFQGYSSEDSVRQLL